MSVIGACSGVGPCFSGFLLVLLISNEQLIPYHLQQNSDMADDDHGGASSSSDTTTPMRRLYRRPRPVSTLEASDGELLYGSASSGHGLAGHRQRGGRPQQEGQAGEDYDEEEREEEIGDVEWLLGTARGAPGSAEIDYTSFHRLGFRDKLRTLIWVHKARLLGHYKIFHHYIERCPCRPCSPLSRSYARSYSRALTGIGPRPCLRAPFSLLGLQGLFIRTPPSADAWRSAAGFLMEGGMSTREERGEDGDGSNAYLVEIFRLQPYAAAAYLRALLYCWIGGVMLQLEAAASFGAGGDTFYERTAWHWLCLQLVLQLLQAPARCKLWRRLVRVSHAAEAEEASERIRWLVTSHLWICSQALGTLFHVVAAFGPLFLYFLDSSSPVRRSVLAACCGNLLVFIVRSSLTFLVVHSIMEARGEGGREGRIKRLKRGLSRNSLSKLKRRESNAEDVVNANQCAICLGSFQQGENLLLLPCHERHVYHCECIETWFKKNRSCPLCMTDVSSPAVAAALAAAAAATKEKEEKEGRREDMHREMRQVLQQHDICN